MRKIAATVCAVIGSLLLILGLLIASIEMFAVNRGFFEDQYAKLDTAQSIGMSEEDLDRATNVLLDYTTGNRDTLDMQADIGGQMQEVFGQREKDHMVDVQALYLRARAVRTVSLVGALVLILAVFVLRGKKGLRTLCRSFLSVSGAFAIVVIALGIYAAVDFSSFWTSFHHLFFTNDLWLLDPRTDVLINMVPEPFFSALVARIIIRFVSIFLTLNIAAAVGALLIKRKERAKEA